jgi:predicted Ser/Thr protein kinase
VRQASGPGSMAAQLRCMNPRCGWSRAVSDHDDGAVRVCPSCQAGLVVMSSPDCPAPTPTPDTADQTRIAGYDPSPRSDRYELRHLLGEGGMGVVYLAHDRPLDRLVALKFPRVTGPAERMRFDREARAAARLRHPQFCPVYDVGAIGDQPFLAMAYIEGETLKDRIDRGPLPPDEAVALVRTLAAALQEAHNLGIIHRDLKPANIMFDARGEPVIMDFGLARLAVADDALQTQSGAVFGTPAYMAPEQALGQTREHGPATDIYALGIIFFEVLTGHRPSHDPRSPTSHEPPRPSAENPALDPALDPLCLKALARSPAERYASMSAFVEALDGYVHTASISPAPQTPTIVVPPVARSGARTGLRLAGVAGLVVLAVVTAIVLWPRPPVIRPPAPSYARTIGIEMVPISGRPGEPSWLMGKTEVTRGQFFAVMKNDPSCPQDAGDTDNLPVGNVTWSAAVRFCNELSLREKLPPYYTETPAGPVVSDPAGPGFRLPTVAEWEAACHAGRSQVVLQGKDPWNELESSWFSRLDRNGPRPVGQGRPNDFGLCDMLGNVWEWCDDGTGGAGDQREVRGGAYDNPAPKEFAEVRRTLSRTHEDCACGFRIARHGDGSRKAAASGR